MESNETTRTGNIRILMQRLGIGENKAYALAHDPSFYPAFRIGKRILINMEKLDRWIFDQGMSGGVNSGEDN